MATPGDFSSKKVKNTFKGIVQYSGANHRIYDGTGSRVTDLDVTRITASRVSVQNIDDLSVLQLDGNLGVSITSNLYLFLSINFIPLRSVTIYVLNILLRWSFIFKAGITCPPVPPVEIKHFSLIIYFSFCKI